MVNVFSLHPGDRVKIVDEWSAPHNENASGRMDKYLGSIMTVMRVQERGIAGPYAVMYEDQGQDDRIGGWLWYDNMIECVLDGQKTAYDYAPSCMALIDITEE